MINTNNLAELIGAEVLDRDDDKIGTVGQIYVDPDDGRPLFASVRTGLFGTSETFVPLDRADADVALHEIHVNYEKSFVKDAPRIDAEGDLSEEQQEALYDYYSEGGFPNTTDYTHGEYTGEAHRDHPDHDMADRDMADSDMARRDMSTGYDTSGPNTDDAMTRSEEQLRVGKERVERGRARLRKYVVTENQSVTVPVSREEVRVEREPITDANRGAAMSGPEMSDEEHEITLNEDRVFVDKETVPVERVRLGKDTVTDEEQVNEQLRKEQIEYEGADMDDTTGDPNFSDRDSADRRRRSTDETF